MKNIKKEINLNVFNDKQRLNYKPVYHGYSGNMLTTADSSFSRRSQVVLEDEEDNEEKMSKDDIILEMAYNTYTKSYNQKMQSRLLIDNYMSGQIQIPVNEGVVDFALGTAIETGKEYIQDIVKNLLSTGAIALTGGAAGDTIIDILFAVKRTKEIYDVYQGIVSSIDILGEFFNEMEKIDLNNNVEQIKKMAFQTVIRLANKNQNLIDTIGDTEIYKNAKKAISNAYDSGKKYINELLEKVKKYIAVLKDKFIEFIKQSNKAIGDWIGTFIPDDFGAGSALYKGLMNQIVNTAMDNALTIFLTITEKVPGDMSKIILNRQALEKYIVENLTLLRDGLAEFYDGSNDGMLAKFIKFQSPAYGMTKAAFDYLDLKNYDVQSNVKFATDFYANIMKYIIAFFSITEGFASGELQKEIENYNKENPYDSGYEKMIDSALDTDLSVGGLDLGQIRNYIDDDYQSKMKNIAENYNKRDDLILEKLNSIDFLNQRRKRMIL